MGAHGKEMSDDQKQMIVHLHNDKLSASKISKMLGLNRFTVAKFIKRFKTTGSVENKDRRGRKTDRRGDRRLLRVVKDNR